MSAKILKFAKPSARKSNPEACELEQNPDLCYVVTRFIWPNMRHAVSYGMSQDMLQGVLIAMHSLRKFELYNELLFLVDLGYRLQESGK